MELSELKLAWDALDRKLDTAVTLNRQLVTATRLTRAMRPLRLLATSLCLEAVSALFLVSGLGRFIFAHAGEPQFVWPAVLLDVWVIAAMAASIMQLFFISGIDRDKPVVEVQTRLEKLRLLRLRCIRWALITGPVVWWLPFLIVAFKAFFGISVYRILGDRFLVVNGLASGAVLPVLVWLSKRFSRNMERSPFFRKIARSIEGGYIDTALDSAAAISAFESEANGNGSV